MMQQPRSASPTMRPRLALPSFSSILLVGLLLAAQHFELASADLLTLLVTATNAPNGALDKAQADAATFLQKFVSLEGSSYKAIAPGQTVSTTSTTTTSTTSADSDTTTTDTTTDSNNAVRMLRGNDLERNEEEGAEVDSLESASHHVHRNLFDCPNTCSDSGSDRCRYLGCAYCGRCNRRHLQANNKHRQIESQLSADLSAYCNGKPDCTIKAVIKRVNADGSVTLAV